MRSLRRALTWASAFAVLWPLAGYPLALALLSRLRPATASSPAIGRLPAMTVIVPTYNEASNIDARLDNVQQCRYAPGALDVIVVDSGSRDGTAERAEEFARRSALPVRVVREPARAGKAAAINIGLAHATAEIIVITDAPTRFDPDALWHIARCFEDPHVGAATGVFVTTGDGGLLAEEEARFWRARNRLRQLEAAVDSTPFLSGELCAFRRSLVPWLSADTLADDMNVALQVRRRSYGVTICEHARFSEPRSVRFDELVETKSRRAAGGLQELLRFRDMIGDRGYGLFGLLIMPSALLYYLPVRVPALLVLAARALPAFRRWPAPLRVLAVLAAMASAPPLAQRFGRQAAMLAFNELIFLRGFVRYLTRRMDVRWTQERSTRRAAPVDVDAA